MPVHALFSRLTLILMLMVGIRAQGGSVDWFYRAWQTEHGLPDNSVTGVAQTPDGYLWVATKGGVMRFNGAEFTPLPLHNAPGLPSRAVRHMFLDRLGQLWLSMERGPVIRIGKDSFHTFTHEEGILKRVVTSMTDDSQGRLWIAFANGACCRIEGNKVTNFRPESGFPSGPRPYLTTDKKGQVWLANGPNLGRLSDDGFELVRDFGDLPLRIAAGTDGLWITTGEELVSLSESGQFKTVARLHETTDVTAVLEDRDGAVWIGSHGKGLFRFKDETIESITTSFGWVDCISQDRDGNIWAGTIGGGLNLIKPRSVSLLQKEGGLPFTSVRSVACEQTGRTWVTSQAGHLAYRDSGLWHVFHSGDQSMRITCVATDREGRIWFGTKSQGLRQLDNGKMTSFGRRQGLASNIVRSILTATNGDVWIATDAPSQLHRFRGGKISKITLEGQIKAMRALVEGPDGTIWVGTSDGHLLRVDGQKLVHETAVEQMPSIRTLHATADGSLWIGYAGEGLGHLKRGKYTRFTTDDGLFDNYISQIQDDGSRSLWIAANRGLFKIHLDELLNFAESQTTKLSYRVFGRNDGLSSFQPSRDYAPESCKGPNGQLYFSTSNGLLQVRPELLREDTTPPTVVLEKVTLDGKVRATYRSRSMDLPDRQPMLVDLSHVDPLLTLPPDHDRLVIDFAALSLGSPESSRLRYRLKPMDTQWEELGNQYSTTFTRLPAGKYEFQLAARDAAGAWVDVGNKLHLKVQPFFWETWWFKISGGLLTVLATAGVVFLNLRRRHRTQIQQIAAKRALEQERSRIARDIHDDLGASLTHISLLSQSSPSQNSNQVLDQIQNTTRHLMRSMDEVVWAINPEHDTFDDLANYLSSYAQEFLSVAGVRCRLELPLDLPEQNLSSQLRHNLFLAFKEALNNVVKYANASEVRISIIPHEKSLTLRVADNGDGIDPDASADPARPTAGNGLVNMTNRMNEIGGTCEVTSSPEQGTTVEFQLPFHPSN